MHSDTASEARPAEPGRFSGWILGHDDSRLFVFLYIGLALVLSIAIGLFWLVVVVAAHFALDMYKYSRLLGSWKAAAAKAAWELKLDLALVIFALWLSVYMDFIFGIAGLGAGARAVAQAGSRTGARFAAWQRVIRGLLLSLDDVGLAVRAAMGRKGGGKEKEKPDGSWRGHWSTGDKMTIALGLASLALMLAAPLITPHTPASMILLLARELHPFP